jgi:hypothetical protein
MPPGWQIPDLHQWGGMRPAGIALYPVRVAFVGTLDHDTNGFTSNASTISASSAPVPGTTDTSSHVRSHQVLSWRRPIGVHRGIVGLGRTQF